MKFSWFGLLELFCMTLLLLLFGFTTFMLVGKGGETYKTLSDRRDTIAQTRIASSYLSMAVRKNDNAGTIKTTTYEVDNIKYEVFVIESADGSDETRIFLYDGKLYEHCAGCNTDFSPTFSESVIAEIDGFSVTVDGSKVSFNLSEAGSDNPVYKFSMTLRTGAA